MRLFVSFRVVWGLCMSVLSDIRAMFECEVGRVDSFRIDPVLVVPESLFSSIKKGMAEISSHDWVVDKGVHRAVNIAVTKGNLTPSEIDLIEYVRSYGFLLHVQLQPPPKPPVPKKSAVDGLRENLRIRW